MEPCCPALVESATLGRMIMAKKTMMQEATDAVKSVAGAALGAAAIAATGVVVKRVAGAIRERGKQLDDSTPEIQKLAGQTVMKPLLPTPKKRATAKRKGPKAKKRVAAKKPVRKPARKKR
jgi:hypothetical protein